MKIGIGIAISILAIGVMPCEANELYIVYSRLVYSNIEVELSEGAYYTDAHFFSQNFAPFSAFKKN